MARIFLLTKIDPNHQAWRGRSDADAVHVCADSLQSARDLAAQLNATEDQAWTCSPWLSELHAECALEYDTSSAREILAFGGAAC